MSAVAAAVLAERVSAACVDAMLSWGAAINRAEALPPGPKKDAAATDARLHGLEAQRLAMALAAKLRKDV